MTNPAQLRKQLLSTRDELDSAQIREKSHRIWNALMTIEEMKTAENIFIYVNFRSEVETLPLIENLLSKGKKVSVPLTRVKEKRLDIIMVTAPDEQLVPGYCGIPEPKDPSPASLVAPEALDAIILPGSAFDLRGGRFGYGGGYYDRLLASIPGTARIALAFETQIVDQLPLQDHDELMDYIITESRIIRNPSRLS